MRAPGLSFSCNGSFGIARRVVVTACKAVFERGLPRSGYATRQPWARLCNRFAVENPDSFIPGLLWLNVVNGNDNAAIAG